MDYSCSFKTSLVDLANAPESRGNDYSDVPRLVVAVYVL